MNNHHHINVNVPTSTIPPCAVQNPYQQIANPSVFPGRQSTGTYPLNNFYGPTLLRDLATIQRAHPELTHQQCQYILDQRIRGTMYALSRGQGVSLSSSQSPGGFLSVLPHDGRMTGSSVPLSRTESCPLPGPTPEKSQDMRRQHSSVDPSTIPGSHFEHPATAPTDLQYRSIQIQQGPSVTRSMANNTMCMVSTLSSSLPPAGLLIQHISAPATGAPTSYIPGLIPSAIAEYIRNFRDDPFSSVRGNACPPSSEQIPVENVTVHGVPDDIGFDGLSQPGFSTQLSHPPLAFPYTIDLSNSAFTAPRMETQLSGSTFFDSTSTNPDLESMDDFLVGGMDIGQGMNGEFQSELTGLIEMSASQLTVRDQRVPVATAPLPSFHTTGGFDLMQQAVNGSFVQTLPADFQVLPELTDTVGTPSSPPQMSRQHSSATSYNTNNFSSLGTLPQFSAPVDVLTAPEMGREWSDLSNSAMPTFYDGPSSFDSQRQRKRVRQSPPEDIELLLKGAGVEADALAASAYDHQYYADDRNGALLGAWSNIPDIGAWQRLNAQLSFAADEAQALEQLGRECGLDGDNPAKLRRVDGQDVCDARAHAKRIEAATLQDVNSNFRSFVPTTHPLPAFDQHLAMRRSESGALPNAIPHSTGNNGAQQLVTATTTATTSTVIDINPVQDTSGAVPRPRGSAGPISINTQMSSRTYVRRTHPRVFCDRCDEVPDGFRGDHELRRHKERVHAESKKVWVTKDISPDGDFLSGCKACKRGKHYFADYNAAAHLRRQHFCKEGKRGKSRKEHDERRRSNIEKVRSRLEKWGIEWREEGPDSARGGGPRTGEEFTLKFLRRWMQQIEIPRTDYDSRGSLTGVLSDEEDDENDESDELKDKDELMGPLGNGNDDRLTSEPTLVAGAQRNEKISHQSPTKPSIPSETLHPEAQHQEARFQPPPRYELIDVAPSADLPQNFLQPQMNREIQALLEPALGRVDLSLDCFYRLQNGLG